MFNGTNLIQEKSERSTALIQSSKITEGFNMLKGTNLILNVDMFL